MGLPSPGDLERLPITDTNTPIGKLGVEREYEEFLRGTAGKHVYRLNPEGAIPEVIGTVHPVSGATVRLTLDVEAQAEVERILIEAIALSNALKETQDEDESEPDRTPPPTGRATAVVMEVNTGAILAMASYPRIDPNTIVDGVTQEEYETYFFDERQPFINRAVEQLYAPASTFKAITLAAALEGGGYEITDRISCPAQWMKVGDQPLRNWKDVDQGRLTPSQAPAESCNTAFFEVGLNLDRVDERLLPSVASGFGFGQPTGILGLNEEPGVNPGPEWKNEHYNEAWFTGDTLNMSIGQGFVAVTVLQMANAYAALATNGVVSTLIIAQSIEPHGRPPEVIDRRSISVLPVSADTLEQLQAALRTTISQPYGTGFYVFQGSILRAAGKSGTSEDQIVESDAQADIGDEDSERDEEIDVELNSEQAGQDEPEDSADDPDDEEDQQSLNHVWFTGWANFEEPRLVVTVVLDNAKSGSDDAGPLVRQVLEGALLNNWVP